MEVLVGVLTHARLETYDLNYSSPSTAHVVSPQHPVDIQKVIGERENCNRNGSKKRMNERNFQVEKRGLDTHIEYTESIHSN